MKEQKRSKTIEIASNALKLESERKWCHMCVCSPFQVKQIYLKFMNWLNS